MRQLNYTEGKLLKKVDFLQWKHENNLREIQVMRRYHVQNREDYSRYNRLCGAVRKLSAELSNLPVEDAVKKEIGDKLCDKLYNIGVIPNPKLSDADNITVSAFCRRRLPIVMVRLKMAETVREAVTFVEQGHIRVGPEPVTDPAFLVTRPMEDFVTWVDTSKIKRKILKYNDKLDDYDLLA